MSAIWGSVSFKGSLESKIDTIMQAPYHERCKIDAFYSECLENCYMGCGVQHITKESVNEKLPIIDSERGLILTADCILDNRNELIQQLNISNSSVTDGELIFHSYLKWGIDCVKHFRGLFSLAIWDKTKKTLYLANDYLANRCLYYYKHDNTISFSTLLEPLKDLHPEIHLNEMYCMDYLAAPAMRPTIVVEETPYQGVFKLPPATILKITEKDIQTINYWSLSNFSLKHDCHTASEYGTYFRNLLTDCVLDAIQTNAEIGIALSSGLDSASVGTIAAELLKENSKSLYAYTYIPYEKVEANTKTKIYNEADDVKAIINLHPNILPHFVCNEGKNAIESITDGLKTFEFPYKAFVNYPNLNEIYSKAAKEGCRIVLTGQFGNCTISHGNLPDIAFDLYQRRKYFTCIKYILRNARHLKISRKKTLYNYLKYLHEMSVTARKEQLSYQLLNPFLSQEFINTYPMKERFDKGKLYTETPLPFTHDKYLETLDTYNLYAYLGECDTKLGLKHGIVLRDPTRDIRMLSFCYQLPYEYFSYQGTPRWLIRGNLRDLFPLHILDNWHRYGLQNKDWCLRIDRDWNSLKENYTKLITSDSVQPYIDTSKVTSILEEEHFSFTSNDAQSNIYLMTAYILAHFVYDTQNTF